MFKIIINLLISFLSLSSSNAYLTNMQELHRQYIDYLRIHNKQETSFGFELFVENLQRIESFNFQNSNCKMYLTQFSDTFDDNAVHKKCKS